MDISPLRLTRFDKACWQGWHALDSSNRRDMDSTIPQMILPWDPEDTFIISRLIEIVKENNAAVGKDDVAVFVDLTTTCAIMDYQQSSGSTGSNDRGK